MSEHKLIYFDIDGGRAEPIRISLHAAGIDFEDVRWSFAEFGEKRQSIRFNAVPVIEIDGKTITQSNAISRYIGRMANLYPQDAMAALYCDEVLEAVEDLTHYIVQTFGLQGDDLKQARTKLVAGRLPVFIRGLNELLTRGGGTYFAAGQLTIADLKVMQQIKSISSGALEHIPSDFIAATAPALVVHQERIQKEPKVVAYYASLKR